MRHGLLAVGHKSDTTDSVARAKSHIQDDFVLEKNIFNNIFDKDIRRVFVYKKAERLAKAIHLIAPAFRESPALLSRVDTIAIGLVDGAILPPSASRTALSRELLTLSSVLAIARGSGLLSAMNADLIAREAQHLLQEVAAYEDPRLQLADAPTLSEIAKDVVRSEVQTLRTAPVPQTTPRPVARHKAAPSSQGHIKDTKPEGRIKDRREAVVSVIRAKGSVSIKDISHMVRGVSEKTVQRELAALIAQGVVTKSGERRWSTYSLA